MREALGLLEAHNLVEEQRERGALARGFNHRSYIDSLKNDANAVLFARTILMQDCWGTV